MLQGWWLRRSRVLACSVAVLAVAALLGPFAASAQSQDATVQINGMTGDAWPQAQVVSSILAADGSTLPGLTPADLHLTLNGSDAPIQEVAQGVNSDQPIDVVLALDVSGSMEGDALDQAKASALSFLELLSPDDQLAIIAFGTTVQTVLPFTTDRAAAQDAIEGLVAEGSTALFQATADSVNLATSGQSGRRAVVLLSDGVDFGSPILREEALASAGTGSVPFFAIGLGNEIDRAYLRDLTELTGGRFAETPTPEGLASLYQDVGELLRGQYIITIDASALGVERSQPLTLRLDVTQGDLAGSDERDVCAQNICAAVAGITAGQQLQGQTAIEAHVVAVEPVTSVALLIDGKAIDTLDAPPYEFSIDTATLVDGDHDIAVEASTASDSVTSGAIGVRIGAAAGSSGGLTGGLLPIAAIAGIAVVVLLIVVLALRRRRGGNAPERGPVAPPPSEPPPGTLRPREKTPKGSIWSESGADVPHGVPLSAPGSLAIMSGELSGQSFPIGGAPVSIGTGHRCAIRVSAEGDDISTEHARVWVRDDALVVHELRRLTAFGPAGGRWEFLGPGETFTVGSNTFQFCLTDDAAPNDLQPDSLAQPVATHQNVLPPIVQPAHPEPAAAPSGTHIPTVHAPEQPHAYAPDQAPTQAQQEPPKAPPFVPPAAEAPGPPAPPVEPQNPDDVPNILRDRPPVSPPEAPAPEPEVPNILRDKTETASSNAQDDASQNAPPEPTHKGDEDAA